MRPPLERIADGEILLSDGGLGTMLVQRGLQSGQCPESFNLEHAEVVQGIAAAYCDAGADFVATNTFGASPIKLAQYGLESRLEEIVAAAVEAARAAGGGQAYVAGSYGPTGKLLKPLGDAEPGEVYAGFVRLVRCLVEAGVDCLFVETMIDLTEAQLAVKAGRAVSAAISICATMTFDLTPRGAFTVMGVNVEQAVRGLHEAGADVVGSNCGNGIEAMTEIAREFRQHTDRPLLIQSNAGKPEIRAGTTVYPETPEFMADKARELIDLGVNIIGGCCGTTPTHIRALRALLDARA